MTKDYLAKNLAQFEDWSDSERNILRAIWEELKKTGSKKVELKLDELKDTCIVGQEHDTWDSVLETFSKKSNTFEILRKKFNCIKFCLHKH